jgi:hypothetical protein
MRHCGKSLSISSLPERNVVISNARCIDRGIASLQRYLGSDTVRELANEVLRMLAMSPTAALGG